MEHRVIAFAVAPLVALSVSIVYTAYASYRLRDWRPPLFAVFLVLMSVHQSNEIATYLATDSLDVVSGFGEYPETAANLTASASVVLVLRLVTHETTLRERLEERIERERELRDEKERLDQFARIVSHDLRNPLNVAQGRLAIAREERDDRHLAVVADSLDRMETILEETLELARKGRTVTDPESIEVATVASQAWQTVETADATLTVEEEFAILADRERTRQLFENLYRNAIEHAGPDVSVRVGRLADGFYVEDDGPGIPADERADVFEPGRTTAADGSGFGLTIVRGIAQAHGWTVSVCEGAEGGARFEVTGVEFFDR